MTNIEEKIIKPKLDELELAKQVGSVSSAFKTLASHTTVSNITNPH